MCHKGYWRTQPDRGDRPIKELSGFRFVVESHCRITQYRMVIAMGIPADTTDYDAHVQTYLGFVRGIVRVVGLLALILILLAYFTT
jgi:hypothetical protein